MSTGQHAATLRRAAQRADEKRTLVGLDRAS